MTRVLLVGNGGREHALASALARSPLLSALLIAPGNPGTASLGRNVPVAAADVDALVALAVAERIDLVVPGPEAPLALGLADRCARAGVACAGPTASAARLEGSKSFAREAATAAGIPGPRYEVFDDPSEALDFVRRRGAPLVIKADGLAGGKGVVVAYTAAEAERAVHALSDGALGAAGDTLLVEECLEGDEVSLFALCDGTSALLLGAAQDHKRIGDGDTGPNTGGMGAVAPPRGFDRVAQSRALDLFVRPMLAEMARRGTPFRGVLFAGLMLTTVGPRLIEYNVRFGDPEAQCLLPLLRSDLLASLLACARGSLDQAPWSLADGASVAVVLAAAGYPGAAETGERIGGVADAAAVPGVQVFEGGTSRDADGGFLSAGGRVLTVQASAPDLAVARDTAYGAIARIDWPRGRWRRDIGARSIG